MNGLLESAHDLLDKGGPFMVPLVVVSLVLFTLATHRFLVLWAEGRVPEGELARSLRAFRSGDRGALERLIARHGTSVTRFLRRTLGLHGRPPEPISAALAAEVSQLRRSVHWLATLTGIAPLLGLMGSVQGMILTFETLSMKGTGDVQALSRGISQALISTQTGLAVALPGLLVGIFIRSRVRSAEARLRLLAARLEREEVGHA